MNRVLVIVVTHNGRHWLDRCLGSVCNDADLYVWDNDSTDGSADFVAANYPQAHLVRSADNLGFAQPNNAGMQYALDKGYDYVYLLNQDAWLAPGALETLVAASQTNPDFAVLSPLQMTDGYTVLDQQFSNCLHPLSAGRKTPENLPGGPENLSAGRKTPENLPGGPEIPSAGRKTPENLSGGPENLSAGRKTPENLSGLLEIKRVMAAHWLVPVSAIKKIGLFDQELFPMWGQDDDWCNRARYKGFKIGVVNKARAVHDRQYREEPKEKLIKRNYYIGSLVRLCDLNRPLWERFMYVCLFTLVKTVKYRSMLPLKYFRTICTQLPAVKEHRKNCR